MMPSPAFHTAARRMALVLGLVFVGVPGAEAMNYRVVELNDRRLCRGGCPSVIVASGRINLNSADRFIGFVNSLPARSGVRSVVMIESPGGNVYGSMRLGAALRRAGVEVVVGQPVGRGGKATAIRPARCFSACVFALVGGAERTIIRGSAIGVHRISRNAYGVDPATGRQALMVRRRAGSDLIGALQSYIRSMGANPALVNAGERVTADSIKVLSPGEIRRYRLGRIR